MRVTSLSSLTASYAVNSQSGGEFALAVARAELLVTGLPSSCVTNSDFERVTQLSAPLQTSATRNGGQLLLTRITSGCVATVSTRHQLLGRSPKGAVLAPFDGQLCINGIPSNFLPSRKNGPEAPQCDRERHRIDSYHGKQQLPAEAVFTSIPPFVTRTSSSYQPFVGNPGRTPLPRQLPCPEPGPQADQLAPASPQMD